MRLRKLFEFVGDRFGRTIDVITTDGRQPIGNGIGPVLEANDVMAVLGNEPDAPRPAFLLRLWTKPARAGHNDQGGLALPRVAPADQAIQDGPPFV